MSTKNSIFFSYLSRIFSPKLLNSFIIVLKFKMQQKSSIKTGGDKNVYIYAVFLKEPFIGYLI